MTIMILSVFYLRPYFSGFPLFWWNHIFRDIFVLFQILELGVYTNWRVDILRQVSTQFASFSGCDIKHFPFMSYLIFNTAPGSSFRYVLCSIEERSVIVYDSFRYSCVSKQFKVQNVRLQYFLILYINFDSLQSRTEIIHLSGVNISCFLV